MSEANVSISHYKKLSFRIEGFNFSVLQQLKFIFKSCLILSGYVKVGFIEKYLKQVSSIFVNYRYNNRVL